MFRLTILFQETLTHDIDNFLAFYSIHTRCVAAAMSTKKTVSSTSPITPPAPLRRQHSKAHLSNSRASPPYTPPYTPKILYRTPRLTHPTRPTKQQRRRHARDAGVKVRSPSRQRPRRAPDNYPVQPPSGAAASTTAPTGSTLYRNVPR